MPISRIKNLELRIKLFLSSVLFAFSFTAIAGASLILIALFSFPSSVHAAQNTVDIYASKETSSTPNTTVKVYNGTVLLKEFTLSNTSRTTPFTFITDSTLESGLSIIFVSTGSARYFLDSIRVNGVNFPADAYPTNYINYENDTGEDGCSYRFSGTLYCRGTTGATIAFNSFNPSSAIKPEVDLTANNAHGAITIPAHPPVVNISFRFTGSGVRCSGRSSGTTINGAWDSKSWWQFISYPSWWGNPDRGSTGIYLREYYQPALPGTYNFYLTCYNSAGSSSSSVSVTVPPYCTQNPTNCSRCDASPNTCSTNNGIQECTMTGPGTCTPVTRYQQCTINRCWDGNCQNNQCTQPPTGPPTVDLKINGSSGPVNFLNGQTLATISWTTGGRPTSCRSSAVNTSGDNWGGYDKNINGGENSYALGNLSAGINYFFRITCSNSLGNTFDDVLVTVSRPNCTHTYANCSGCITPANTCSASNGTETCQLTRYGDGSTPCNPVNTSYSCTRNNCSSGYNCSSGSCVPNVVTPTVDLQVNNSNGPVAIDNGQSVSLSWSTTNSPTSCTATGSWSGGKSASGGSENTSLLTGPNTYTYTITCSNSAGSTTDSVTVTVKEPTIPINTQASNAISRLTTPRLILNLIQSILQR